MNNVAIDGPGGVGKGTVAGLVAKKLNWLYLDTGALYRAVVVYVLQNKINYENLDELFNSLSKIKITVKYNSETGQKTFLNGKDVSTEIRSMEVEKIIQYITKHEKVRELVKDIQINIAKNNNVVMEGRDIGTVILPKSKNKFFLTASSEIRAQRRCLQLKEKNGHADYNEILEAVKKRDYEDSTREISPLKPAEDCMIIDTSDLSIDEVVKIIINNVK